MIPPKAPPVKKARSYQATVHDADGVQRAIAWGTSAERAVKMAKSKFEAVYVVKTHRGGAAYCPLPAVVQTYERKGDCWIPDGFSGILH